MRRLTPYALLTPAVLALLVFVVLPLVLVTVLSFFDLNLITNQLKFVGFTNYATELGDDAFWTAVRNTILYGLYTVVPSLGIGLGIALLISGLDRGQAFWRSVYFLPVACTLVAMSSVWRWMFQPDIGIVDQVFGPILGVTDWLNNPQLALVAIAVVGNWHQIGLVAILYLAALGSIPTDPYDSARLDGAGAVNRFWHVTWPALGPTTVFAVVVTCSAALQAYDTIVAMTGGGPAGATETLTYAIWTRGIRYFDLGRAAVLSVFLLGLSLVITGAQRSRTGRTLETAGTR
ncbi:carbohydrate ABC transporter permease [Plantibacter sp. Mn2098]|uniref:carbohydrate ABC transporter permease n=1 Tax=Plantibacter sp. Mn2098 TaxID=3395266 RepID=UPI003BD40D66